MNFCINLVILFKIDLRFIGMPSFIAAGTHTKNDLKKTAKAIKEPTRYRFLVMPRFGSDLQKVLDSNGFKLPLKAAYTIGIRILDILEYIHSHGYIHADIKASNLLLSFKKSVDDSQHEEIWLVDFGLVEKYLQSDNLTHKPYEEDNRRANNGTIEFTSRDAHIGCFSRKGDIEILAYNLLSWLSGSRLPWMANLVDKKLVKNLKNSYMDRLDDLLNYAFPSASEKIEKVYSTSTKKIKISPTNKLSKIPDGISDFFKQVIKMKFDEKPNYKLLKSILEKAINNSGEKYDGKFYLKESNKMKNSSVTKKISPLKRKHPVSKSPATESLDDISVVFDEESNEDEEIIIETKRPRKASNNVRAKSPIVLNAKVASNGRSKSNSVHTVNSRSNSVKLTNGKSTSDRQTKTNGKSSSQPFLNGINKLDHNELNHDELDELDESTEDVKKRRRVNPSRKVKHSALNENNKFVSNEPIKNGRVKNSETIYNKSENQIVYNGKVWTNPTPAMIELFNRMNNKNK